ncbi:CESA [Mytilus coruscus]|uniref:CESA n=1 Tax=Mytilus coruscus TaxID=42192 RepID=A0A6J8EL50_MYTCO|nr:CESA [Mytilus coruscus]
MMNAVRDILASNNVFTKITSGSFGEGLQMQGSDLDVMCVLKEYCVCEEINIKNIKMHRNTAYFMIETENTQPGYVQLRLVYNGNKIINGLSGEIKGEHYFSSEYFKKRFLDEDLGFVIHGPCISDKYDLEDFAVCLHSQSWVIQAEQWITRSNTSWPGSNVKQHIIQHGVLFVPIDDMLKTVIHLNLSSKSNKIKRMFLYHMSRMRRLDTKKINYGNKQSYQQCKTCLSSLLQKLYHDAASGLIMIASFFYSRKQYDIALDILQYSLSKCTPEKLHLQMNLSHIHNELLNVHIFRKMNGVHLLKTLLVDTVCFFHDCMLIPDELNFELMICMYLIPSVVYSHFLRFLCHYHLGNTRTSLDCLLDIQITIDVSYFIENPVLKGVSYNILGIAFQLIGDKESAKQAFMQSLRLFPYREYNTAYLRLSLIC